MTSVLDAKGRVTIPKAIRDKLGLKKGDKLLWVLHLDNSLGLVPKTLDLRELQGSLPLPDKRLSLEEMDEAIARR